MFKKFWAWYERHETLNLGLAAVLFLLQLFHLYWLTTHVVLHRAFGLTLFDPSPVLELVLIFVDYLEIPTLLGVSLVYLNELRRGGKFKSALYLFLTNTQWLHIFWITDEFVVERLTGTGAGTVLPFWLAWVAIAIDYLELPVIFDTTRRFLKTLREKNLRVSLAAFREESPGNPESDKI